MQKNNCRNFLRIIVFIIGIQPTLNNCTIVDKAVTFIDKIYSKCDIIAPICYAICSVVLTGIVAKICLYFTFKRQRNFIEDNIDNKLIVDKSITFKNYVDVPKEVQSIVDEIKNVAPYKEMKVDSTSGLLLYGPPGTGKTFLARAMAGELEIPFFAIGAADFIIPWVGSGSQALKKAYCEAQEAAKKSPKKTAILFIDEIDAIGKRITTTHSPNQLTNSLTTMLLELMDGISKDPEYRVMIIGATNRLNALDEALLRQGRFGTTIMIDRPSNCDRKERFEKLLQEKPSEPNINLDGLVQLTEGCNHMDLEGIFNKAGRLAIRDKKSKRDNICLLRALLKVKFPKKENLAFDEERLNIIKHNQMVYGIQYLNSSAIVQETKGLADYALHNIFRHACENLNNKQCSLEHIKNATKTVREEIRKEKKDQAIFLCESYYNITFAENERKDLYTKKRKEIIMLYDTASNNLNLSIINT